MRVQDVVDMARYSEAAGTAIKNNVEAIVLFLNAGLVELYKRFPVATKEHVIVLSATKSLYELPADYMYALGAFEQLVEGDITTIVEVPINDESNDQSIFFPNYRQVQIPFVTPDASISIVYVSKPRYYDPDDLSDELEIPDTLVDCLLHYIGYKAHLGIRSDGQSENTAHYVRFERSCDKARELGVAHPLDSLSAAKRLATRGFV